MSCWRHSGIHYNRVDHGYDMFMTQPVRLVLQSKAESTVFISSIFCNFANPLSSLLFIYFTRSPLSKKHCKFNLILCLPFFTLSPSTCVLCYLLNQNSDENRIIPLSQRYRNSHSFLHLDCVFLVCSRLFEFIMYIFIMQSVIQKR